MGLVVPGAAQLPKTQELLIPLLQQNEQLLRMTNALVLLAEANVRASLGQSAEDIQNAMGLEFPVPTAEELAEKQAALEAAEADQALLEETQ